MATKLVNWTSKDGQIIKSRLSEGRRAKFLPSVVWFAYDCHGIESYLGNVGLGDREDARLFNQPCNLEWIYEAA